ncbi:MAG: GTP diphosphokinase [Pseudomonadota bacterium]
MVSTVAQEAIATSEEVAWLDELAAGRTPEERQRLAAALARAEGAHAGQVRASGEPYVHHVVAVALILAGMQMDTETLVAALLHDVLEDSAIERTDLEAEFGEGVARLVDGVTKMRLIETLPGGTTEREAAQAESLRKLLLAMAEDVRVVLIKLADRLHNVRTLEHLFPDKQRRIARETLEVFAPLANRLGIWQIKWELEDRAFRYLDPEAYHDIAAALDERRVERETFIRTAVGELERSLQEAGIAGEVVGRPKHIYSIWRKMQRKGVGIDQLYDLRAVRILVDSVADCYHALGVVHTLWRHIPREFDDYIATPKENNYQSIHTAVVGPSGRTLEVQIRTREMHRQAELGIAAHWRYKEGGGQRELAFEQKIAWLRQLLEWKDEEASASDFVDRFKSEAFQERIYALTPAGEIIDLPQGATPVDFAYHIHSEVGHRCRGARVNGRMVPLNYPLSNGEQVSILTARGATPSRDWLNPQLGYVHTSRARSHIRHWFKHQDRERHVADGRGVVDRELRRLGVPDLRLESLAGELGQASVEELLAAVGRGDLTSLQVARAVHRLHPMTPAEPTEPVRPRRRTPPRQAGSADDIEVEGVGNLVTRMAGCCNPAPGDDIVGYVTQGRGVTIHRSDCPSVLNLDEAKRHRLMEVAWAGERAQAGYPVAVVLRAYDRPALLRDVSTVLADERVNVDSVQTRSDAADGTARMDLGLAVHDTDQLSRVLNRLSQLRGVLEVQRRVQ